MFCRNCGIQQGDQAAFCTGCGAAAGAGNKYCFNCGAIADPNAAVCVKCGVALHGAPAGYQAGYPGAAPGPQPGYAPPVQGGYAGMPPNPLKSKLTAGLLGIFLGGFGVHRFYLGYTTIGIL